MDSEQMVLIDNASPEELEQMLNSETPTTPETEQRATEQQQPIAEKSADERLKEFEERMAKYEKQLRDKESFINQRNQEVGQLRKKLSEYQSKVLAEDVEPTDEEIIRDPKEAVKKAIERAEHKRQLEAEREAEMQSEIARQNEELLHRLVPTFDTDRTDIVEVMKADGIPQDMVAGFEANPTVLHPSIIFQLQKRAEMMREIKALKAKLGEAKAEPKKIADNLARYGQAKSPVTQQPPNPKTNKRLDNLSEADIDKLSLEELKELSKEL